MVDLSRYVHAYKNGQYVNSVEIDHVRLEKECVLQAQIQFYTMAVGSAIKIY